MQETSQAGSIKAPRRILVVDDNEINLFVATETLEILGYQYDTAKNGTNAVELFSHRKYDVILMDFQMPDMDGVEAMQQIRSYELRNDLDRTPIVVITANINFKNNYARHSNNLDGVIIKPYNTEQLSKAINSLCSDIKSALIKEPEEF